MLQPPLQGIDRRTQGRSVRGSPGSGRRPQAARRPASGPGVRFVGSGTGGARPEVWHGRRRAGCGTTVTAVKLAGSPCSEPAATARGGTGHLRPFRMNGTVIDLELETGKTLVAALEEAGPGLVRLVCQPMTLQMRRLPEPFATTGLPAGPGPFSGMAAFMVFQQGWVSEGFATVRPGADAGLFAGMGHQMHASGVQGPEALVTAFERAQPGAFTVVGGHVGRQRGLVRTEQATVPEAAPAWLVAVMNTEKVQPATRITAEALAAGFDRAGIGFFARRAGGRRLAGRSGSRGRGLGRSGAWPLVRSRGSGRERRHGTTAGA